MRTIVQISDLHFGAILEPTLVALRDRLWALKPDLLIVSGDLTQRAKIAEFRLARAYLNELPVPQVVLPGNHDVPLYNVLLRFLQPLNRYTEIITSNLAPMYVDSEIAVACINTARSFVIKGGRLGEREVAEVLARFSALDNNQIKIVVGHHPFDIPEGLTGVQIVKGIESAMAQFAKCGVDLFLAGHLHLVYVSSAAKYHPGYDATIMQAGTATSSRARGEPNSFFVFRTDGSDIAAETHSWDAARGRFEVSATRSIQRAR